MLAREPTIRHARELGYLEPWEAAQQLDMTTEQVMLHITSGAWEATTVRGLILVRPAITNRPPP